MLKSSSLFMLLISGVFTFVTPKADASIIHISSSDVSPGATSYLAAGDTSVVGGWPTPYENLLTTTTLPQYIFGQEDDIRIGTKIDQNALDRTTDDYEVNKPNEAWWADWGDDYWQADKFLWRTMFYHLDVNDEWQWVTGWNSYTDWSTIETWQANPDTSAITLWTGAMAPYLPENKWQIGSWSAISFFEGDWDNRQTTNFTVVPEPKSLLVFSLALILLFSNNYRVKRAEK